MRSNPEFDFVTSGIITSYNQTSVIFTGLILIGLLAMFYISSHTVEERDEAQQLLFQERERQIKENIHHQKEALFTKRIYHTHHKAEKVMGFIKEDLRLLSAANIEEIKYRMSKYANFISRVIYDMKWYDPPLHAIRNPLFRTNLNEVIRFLVDHIFLRIASRTEQYQFELDLDASMPGVPVNEFVVWEILEPLLQNCLDHGGDHKIIIRIQTHFDAIAGAAQIVIADNGCGIQPELLTPNEDGIKRLFLEQVSTKKNGQNSGYGCYIAYEIATQRCGWHLDAENLDAAGCQFTITIPHLVKRG